MLRKDGLMEERDYQTYCSLFSNMSNFMNRPNLIIHLEVTPEESMERIKARSRNCETSIQIEYLRNLYNGYEEFIAEISKVTPVLRVNWHKFRTEEVNDFGD
jgi:deoxyadenosine kinase